MEKILNDIFRSAREGFTVMAVKANDLARAGRLKLDVIAIKYQIDKLRADLGARVYHLLAVEKQAQISTDPTVQSLIRRIEELEGQVEYKRQQAHDIFYNEVLEESPSTSAATAASPSAAQSTPETSVASATTTVTEAAPYGRSPAASAETESTSSPEVQPQATTSDRKQKKNVELDVEAEAAGEGLL
jgi:hypothetical protein